MKGGVVNGLITVIALVARNVYRMRHALYENADLSVIECASYRTNLKYVSKRRSDATLRVVMTVAEESTSDPEYVKNVRYVKQMGTINASDTLLHASWVRRALFSSRIQHLVNVRSPSTLATAT